LKIARCSAKRKPPAGNEHGLPRPSPRRLLRMTPRLVAWEAGRDAKMGAPMRTHWLYPVVQAARTQFGQADLRSFQRVFPGHCVTQLCNFLILCPHRPSPTSPGLASAWSCGFPSARETGPSWRRNMLRSPSVSAPVRDAAKRSGLPPKKEMSFFGSGMGNPS